MLAKDFFSNEISVKVYLSYLHALDIVHKICASYIKVSMISCVSGGDVARI